MIKMHRVRFPGGIGEEIAAQLDVPGEKPPVAYALVAHCFTCSKNLKAIHNISRALVESGWAALRIDFTGLGDSAGDFSRTNLSSNIGDLVAAARYLESEHRAPALLIGHSLGGSAVLGAASRIKSCRAVAVIATPDDPRHLSHLLADARRTANDRGEIEVEIGGRRFRLSRQFFQDLEKQNPFQTIRNLGRALLVVHAPDDDVVPIEHGLHIFETAAHPKAFVSVAGADHLLSGERDSRYVGGLIAFWSSRMLG